MVIKPSQPLSQPAALPTTQSPDPDNQPPPTTSHEQERETAAICQPASPQACRSPVSTAQLWITRTQHEQHRANHAPPVQNAQPRRAGLQLAAARLSGQACMFDSPAPYALPHVVLVRVSCLCPQPPATVTSPTRRRGGVISADTSMVCSWDRGDWSVEFGSRHFRAVDERHDFTQGRFFLVKNQENHTLGQGK
ncbi:unnamed protein product [Diplocarpon coronariae]